jgi:hypothetical protein
MSDIDDRQEDFDDDFVGADKIDENVDENVDDDKVEDKTDEKTPTKNRTGNAERCRRYRQRLKERLKKLEEKASKKEEISPLQRDIIQMYNLLIKTYTIERITDEDNIFEISKAVKAYVIQSIQIIQKLM